MGRPPNTPDRDDGRNRRPTQQHLTLLNILLANVGMFLVVTLFYEYRHRELHVPVHGNYDEAVHAPPALITTTAVQEIMSTAAAAAALPPTFPPVDERYTILPHELPGYTGWARPQSTLAHYYTIKIPPSKTSFNTLATVGKPYQLNVRCDHPHCKNGGALFFLRAYGPAILPGKVKDHGNGVYTFTVIPHDPGQYYYEAVLTFSKAPKFEELPVSSNPGEPYYEGYMLPGFPIFFQAQEQEQDQDQTTQQDQTQQIQRRQQQQQLQKQLPKCQARHLVDNDPDAHLKRARWVLANKTRHEVNFEEALVAGTDYKTKDEPTLEGYQYSINSVGVQMEYLYKDCELESLATLTDPDYWIDVIEKSPYDIVPGKKQIHFLFFGDSNIRNQHNFFRDRFAKPTKFLTGRIKLSYVEVMKFWPLTWDKARNTYHNVTRDNPDDHFVVIYNLGLHEIANRCALFGQRAGRVKSDPGPCIPFYQEDVGNMTDLVKSKKAMIKIWQSTTAGWPKWGVFGVAWPQKGGQPFPQATDTCAKFNKVAWDIVRKAGMKVMDTYWMTLSRPDHREVVDKDASRTSYKLVHMGPEVYLLLLRQILTIALEAIRNGKPGQQYL